MLQVRHAQQWFAWTDIPGVEWIRPRVVRSVIPGCEIEEPAQYFVRTPHGQTKILPGDWVITCLNGHRYVIKNHDYITQ